MKRYICIEDLGIGMCNPDVFEDKGYAKGWNAAVKLIESAPVEEVIPYKEHLSEMDAERKIHMEAEKRLARPNGEWIHLEGTFNESDNYYQCSICGRAVNVIYGDDLKSYPYCHCGAKMVKREVRFDESEH